MKKIYCRDCEYYCYRKTKCNIRNQVFIKNVITGYDDIPDKAIINEINKNLLNSRESNIELVLNENNNCKYFKLSDFLRMAKIVMRMIIMLLSFLIIGKLTQWYFN
jgi:hypothetical protein